MVSKQTEPLVNSFISQTIWQAERSWIKTHLPPRSIDFFWAFGNKAITRAFLRAADVPLPDCYGTDVNNHLLAGMMKGGEHSSLVLKPLRATGSRCALALRRGPGLAMFDNVLSGHRRCADSWIEWLNQGATQHHLPRRWIVEECLQAHEPRERLPVEYKFYMFRRDVVLIAARRPIWKGNCISARHRFFDADWKPVNCGAHQASLDSTIPVPDEEGRRQLMEMSQRVSGKMLLPHIRVDLYLTNRGPVCGELTIAAGTCLTLTARWCKAMCDAWERSADLLAAEIHEGKQKENLELHRRVMADTERHWRK